MTIIRIQVFKVLLFLIFLAGVSYLFKDPISQVWQYLESQYLPCQNPINYSIGGFDKRFGISKDDFLKAVQRAEAIWEAPIQRQLFVYSGKGSLSVNLIYDYRQEATQKLQNLGIAIKDDEATYNTLKLKYASLQVLYSQQKSSLESLVSSYQAKKDAYQQEVAYWNKRGGASKLEYNKIEQERGELNALVAEINQVQNSLNQSVDSINAIASVLNKLVSELNLQVNKYNTVGAGQGGEFEEGEYKSGAGGAEINIYQFDDRGKLVRVLAHELGHALGLNHLDNPRAIMYRLNSGINEKLTADDVAALKNRCGIK